MSVIDKTDAAAFMDAHILKIYHTETLAQCRFAILAFDDLTRATAKIEEALRIRDRAAAKIASREIFRAVHSFLTHTSNVSKLLWPAPPRKQKDESRSEWKKRCAANPQVQRGVALMRSLKHSPKIETLRSRKLRDHLEHFDERLDAWQAHSKSHNYVQDTVGPANAIVGVDAEDIMRWYDPNTQRMHFRGETFNLTMLSEAASALESTLLKLLPPHLDW